MAELPADPRDARAVVAAIRDSMEVVEAMMRASGLSQEAVYAILDELVHSYERQIS
jgi:hypothetical protein